VHDAVTAYRHRAEHFGDVSQHTCEWHIVADFRTRFILYRNR
jgi:hypothetical protein